MRNALAAILILLLPMLALAACHTAPDGSAYPADVNSRPNPLQAGGGGGAGAGGM